MSLLVSHNGNGRTNLVSFLIFQNLLREDSCAKQDSSKCWLIKEDWMSSPQMGHSTVLLVCVVVVVLGRVGVSLEGEDGGVLFEELFFV